MFYNVIIHNFTSKLKTIYDLNVPLTTPGPPPRANIAIWWPLRKYLYFCMTFNVEDSPKCVLKIRKGREKCP